MLASIIMTPYSILLLAVFVCGSEITHASKSPYYSNTKYDGDIIDSQTKTEYAIKTIQIGSAPLSRNVGHISPDHNQTRSYLSKTDTIVHTVRRPHHKHPKHTPKRRPIRYQQASTLASDKSELIKCPTEKTLIARRRLDGALIEAPQLTSAFGAQSRIDDFKIETLFSPHFNFALPQGSHSILARVVNKKTRTVERMCLLKYTVIVRQCSKYYSPNSDLTVNCDVASIWGSKCQFECRGSGVLSHNEPVECNDNLMWSGKEPTCYYRQSTDYCNMPMPPENGKFSCRLLNGNGKRDDNHLNAPNGSMCNVECIRNYHIPRHFLPETTFLCENGYWNSTMRNFCRKNKNRNDLWT